jgi:hypothetical protein
MSEAWIGVIDAGYFQSLSLRLVNGHRKTQLDGW